MQSNTKMNFTIDTCDTSQKMLRGAYSYLNDKRNGIHLTDQIDVIVERVNNNVARIFFRSRQNGQQIALDALPGVLVIDMAGNPVQPYHNDVMITWADSYRVCFAGKEILILKNQKQQALMATENSADAEFFSEN